MNADQARSFVRGLAGYDAMVPVHQSEFDKAVDCLVQVVMSGVLNDLNGAKTKASSDEEEAELVSEVMNDLAREHRIRWSKVNGYQPVPKNG